jgi:hypothetical protein
VASTPGGELDLEAQLVAVIGLEPRPLQRRALALAHLDRLLHAQEALGCVLQRDARALQQEDEGGGRAVEDGHLLGGDVDMQVVQAQPGAGRQQVLDGLHLGPAGVAAGRDGGGHAGVAHRLRRHRDVHRLRQVDAAEHDAGVGRRRSQRQLDPAGRCAHPRRRRARWT